MSARVRCVSRRESFRLFDEWDKIGQVGSDGKGTAVSHDSCGHVVDLP